MTAKQIREQIKDLPDEVEIFVCNDYDGSILWRTPWVHIVYNKEVCNTNPIEK